MMSQDEGVETGRLQQANTDADRSAFIKQALDLVDNEFAERVLQMACFRKAKPPQLDIPMLLTVIEVTAASIADKLFDARQAQL